MGPHFPGIVVYLLYVVSPPPPYTYLSILIFLLLMPHHHAPRRRCGAPGGNVSSNVLQQLTNSRIGFRARGTLSSGGGVCGGRSGGGRSGGGCCSGHHRSVCLNRIVFHPREKISRDIYSFFAFKNSCTADVHVDEAEYRYAHVRDVLKLKDGAPLKCGVIGRYAFTGKLVNKGTAVQVLDIQRETATPNVDLILCPPRPKALKRLWRPMAEVGVRTIHICAAETTNQTYLNGRQLDPKLIKNELQRALEMCGDVYPVHVSISDAPSKTYRLMRSLADGEAVPPPWCFRNLTSAIWELDDDDITTLPPPPLSGPRVLATVSDAAVAFDGVEPPTVAEVLRGHSSATLAVGPERGWSSDEYALLVSQGWTPATLFRNNPRRVLDSSTAALSLLSVAASTLAL